MKNIGERMAFTTTKRIPNFIRYLFKLVRLPPNILHVKVNKTLMLRDVSREHLINQLSKEVAEGLLSGYFVKVEEPKPVTNSHAQIVYESVAYLYEKESDRLIYN